MRKRGPPRDRNRPLNIYVNEGERETINAKADAAGMTVSSYVRTAALNQRIRSVFEQDAIRILSKVNADQGRLGGLLRMYLCDGDAAGSVARALLDQIKSVQRDLAEAARKVK